MRAQTLLVVLLTLPLLAQSQSAAKKLAEAGTAYDAGRFEEALIRYEEAVKLDPEVADERRLVEFSFIFPDRAPAGSKLRTDPAELKRVKERALSLVRRHLDARGPTDLILFAYVGLLNETGRTKDGIDWFDAARAGDPKSVLLIRGSLLLAALSGDHARTLAALDDLSRTAADAVDLHYGGAIVYEAAKKAPAAQSGELLARGVALERAALAKSPDSIESLTFLSVLLEQQAALATADGEKTRLMAESEALSKKVKELIAHKQ